MKTYVIFFLAGFLAGPFDRAVGGWWGFGAVILAAAALGVRDWRAEIKTAKRCGTCGGKGTICGNSRHIVGLRECEVEEHQIPCPYCAVRA